MASTLGGLMGFPAMSEGIVMYVGSFVIRQVSSSYSAGTTMRV